MIVGIDIDDTMTNHCKTWFKIYNEDYKKENVEPLKVEDAYKWNFYDEWNEDDKKRLMDAMHSGRYFKEIELLPNVVKIISEIINSENKVIIISSTYKELQEQKRNWLLDQIPILSEDDIVFTKNKELINVDVMIDDNLAYASKFNCPFLLYRQPWNTGRPPYEYSENIVNVGNWKDIEDILIKLGIINIAVSLSSDEDVTFNEATQNFIQGIKNAETNEEIADILNPYIKMWQQQGMLIGMKQINDATLLVVEDVMKQMKEEAKNVKK